MIVRNKIWEELRQAKVNIICIQRYTDRNRKLSRYFGALIIIFASVGTIGGIFEQWIAVIASGLVATSSGYKYYIVLNHFFSIKNNLLFGF